MGLFRVLMEAVMLHLISNTPPTRPLNVGTVVELTFDKVFDPKVNNTEPLATEPLSLELTIEDTRYDSSFKRAYLVRVQSDSESFKGVRAELFCCESGKEYHLMVHN